MNQQRILVAGIGNIFLGDDAFGVEVVQRLMRRELPDDVHVVDFGIRSLDLTYALLNGYETVILVDASPRGGQPGTLHVLEPEVGELAEAVEAHSLDAVKVLRLAALMGGQVSRLLLVACEPASIEVEEMQMEMSPPVRAAVEQACQLIEALVLRMLHREKSQGEPCTSYPLP
jgi:hydrogenase maturation protease